MAQGAFWVEHCMISTRRATRA